ncbi:MAG TPA: RDD family protein [Planctomicrobium sp.]|nr:RDD family protein [Planctomicrobium sp.]
MPKIRCQGCETVLNAPDKARGKVIACPKCGTKVRVPGEASAAPPQQKSAAKRPKQDQGVDFASLDLNRLEATSGEHKICPYCTAEMDPEDPICRSCGMNVEKGQMDAAEQRRRSIKGPDPALFYSNVWKESWQFMLDNSSLAVRSGLFWWLFATLNAVCAYMSLVFCQQAPTKAFWGALTVLTGFGIPGWYLYVQLKVITSTMLKETFREDRVHFDFFQSVAGGTRTLFWPLVVIGPLFPALLLIYGYLLFTGNPLAENTTLLFGALAVVLLLPVLVFPIALIHMTTRHTYKAWILWELLNILGKNVGPTLYLIFISLMMCLPTLVIAGGIFYLIGATNPIVSDLIAGAELEDGKFTPGLTGNITLWLMKIADVGTDQESVWYTLLKGPLNILATAIVFAPIALSSGFPALFVMKAIALFGHYRGRSLDLVTRIYPNTPATYWVRYLAHTVDLWFMPLTGFLVSSNAKALTGFWCILGFSVLIWLFSPQLLIVALIGLPLYTSWMYWSVQESSQLRSTLGKDIFGLIVVTENDETLTLQQATGKWFLRTLWYFSFGLPFLMCLFHPEKRALHDLVTHTKVVFKGDK